MGNVRNEQVEKGLRCKNCYLLLHNQLLHIEAPLWHLLRLQEYTYKPDMNQCHQESGNILHFLHQQSPQGCYSTFFSTNCKYSNFQFDFLDITCLISQEIMKIHIISPRNTFPWSPTAPCNLHMTPNCFSLHKISVDINLQNLGNTSSLTRNHKDNHIT